MLEELLPKKNSSTGQIDRALQEESYDLKLLYLDPKGMTPEDFAKEMSRFLVNAPRRELAGLYWKHALAYWLLEQKPLAREAARRFLACRPSTLFDRLNDSIRQRGRRIVGAPVRRVKKELGRQ